MGTLGKIKSRRKVAGCAVREMKEKEGVDVAMKTQKKTYPEPAPPV